VKKLLSLLLALVMVISVFAVAPITASAATYNFLFPVNNGGRIAYIYGYSNGYFNGTVFHNGIDIHSNGDDNIYAAESGTVANTANPCECISEGSRCPHNDTFGNYVKIKHSNGTYSYYGHLLHDSIKVSVGQTVTKGQVIATMGSSGNSSGKHLHFEVRLSDSKTKVNVNPTSNGGSVNYSYSGYGTPTPSFTYTSISTGKYYLKHNATGKYMNVSYGTDANKQNVDLYDGFYTAEVMNIISTSYGYKMRPECCTSRVINVWGDNPSSGANVTIYDDTAHSTQSWKFQAVSGGYIIHSAYNTSLVLDNNNGNVCVNTYTGGSSQIWSLVPYHTHNYNTHSHYGSEHPHYQYLKCSCGATQVNTSKTSLKDGCDQCYPAMPVLNVRAGSDAEYVQFYWDATNNTDSYDLPIYDAKTGDRLYFFTGIETLNYQVKLPAGEYIASLASINKDLYDSGADRWYTYGSRVTFTVTTGEFKSSAESIVDGKRYELFNIAMPWTEAKAKCEELGGHLVTITSQEEADVVNSLVAKGGRTNYWLGLSDHENEGQWKSVTGESISYSNWGTDEPNNYLGLEDYATVIQDSFKWNDVMNMYGSYSLGFICEYEVCGESATWIYNQDSKTLTIKGVGEMYDYKYNNLYGENKYTPWDRFASEIENVVIDEGIEKIGNYSFFRCTNLVNVAIPTTLESSGNFAFDFCDNLTNVYISDLAKWCAISFSEGENNPLCTKSNLYVNGKLITNLTIPDDVKAIENNAFIQCSSIESVVMPQKVSSVGWFAFCNCKNLNSIFILNVNCNIADSYQTFPKNAVIYGYDNSTAQAYAEKYSREFVSLGIAPVEKDILGDVDGNGKVSIMDATEIQRHIAQLSIIPEDRLACTDTNKDTRVSILDATQIQLFIAKLIPSL